jgi:hypothetical protein
MKKRTYDMSLTQLFWDGKTIALDKAVRVRQSPRASDLPGTIVEGLLVELPNVDFTKGTALVVHLVFLGDVEVDFVPGYGDTLEQVE